jgi:D-mannonate dehydratase
MGNIIKINMYVEKEREKSKKLKLKIVEENISEYNIWLQKNKREDKIESYEEFLRAK